MTEQLNWPKPASERVTEIYEQILDNGGDMPPESEALAKTVAETVSDTDWAARRSVDVVAGGSIYVADTVRRGTDRIGQRELCDAIGITPVTFRKHYHNIPNAFLTAASEIELIRHGETVAHKIMLYSAAERAGIGLANIDIDEQDPEALRDMAAHAEAITAEETDE